MAYYVPSITTMGVLTSIPALRHVVPCLATPRPGACTAPGEWVDITSRVASGAIRKESTAAVATLELRLLGGRQYPSFICGARTAR